MYRMDESQNPTKVETDTSKGNVKNDENISTPSSSTSSTPVISGSDNLDEKIQKIEMKGNSSKKLATSNVKTGDSNLLQTGGNQIKASASNQLLGNQSTNVTSSGSATGKSILICTRFSKRDPHFINIKKQILHKNFSFHLYNVGFNKLKKKYFN